MSGTLHHVGPIRPGLTMGQPAEGDYEAETIHRAVEVEGSRVKQPMPQLTTVPIGTSERAADE